jgi:hypothetical protein
MQVVASQPSAALGDLVVSAIGNRLHDYPKPTYTGSRQADDGQLWVFVATNLFGNIVVPKFFP